MKKDLPEDKFANTTCADVRRFIKILPEKACEDEVSKIYEEALAKCPKGAVSLADAPSPNDKCALCEDLVKVAVPKVIDECDQLCKKSPIDSICEKFCTLAQTEVTPDRVCKAIHMCAGGSNGIPADVVKKIEKLVCEAVEEELPEDKFASMACEHLTKVFTFLPEKTCEDVVSKIYEEALASCPKSIVV